MSDESCGNDCVAPLRFPRRPGEVAGTVHGENCSCCAPSARVSLDNRPALPHFSYRIGTYGTIREWLFHRINQTPELRHWTHRAADDPAVALLEGASILGDILCFYQDTYANEAFLRTAQWRESIGDLVRLSGYRLSPAVGGRATFAFEIKKDEPVVVPAGFPLKATLAEFPSPVTFETLDDTTAYPWLSRFNLFKPLVNGEITTATTEFSITYPEQLLQPINLKAGDRLLVGDADLAAVFGAAPLPNAEVVIVDSVSELHGRKTYKIKGNLKRTTSVGALHAFRLGRAFHHLGNNGPATIPDPSRPVTSTTTTTAETASSPGRTETATTIPQLHVPLARPIRNRGGIFAHPAIGPAIRDVEFPLDAELQDFPSQVPVIIQTRIAYPGQTDVASFSDFYTLLRTLRRIDPVAQTWGAISGAVSKFTVSAPISDSIGDGDPVLQAAAIEDARQASEDAADALADAATARQEAIDARAQADLDAAAAAAADAEVALKTTELATAEAKAANLAVAAAIAASALKDGPTDDATQAALDAANGAVVASNNSKALTHAASTAVDNAAAAAHAANTAGVVNFAAAAASSALQLGLNVPLDLAVAADGVVMGFIIAADAAVTGAKAQTDVAEAAVDITDTKVVEAQRLVSLAREAAREDAEARERSRLADEAASDASEAAGDAAEALDQARQDADDAHEAAARSADTADDREGIALDLEAQAATLVEIAAIKEAAKVTRMYIGDALIHEVTTPLFTLKRAQQETTAASGLTLNFYGTVQQVESLAGRRILFEKDGVAAGTSSVASVSSASAAGTEAFPQLHEITLSAAVTYADFPNRAPSVTVYGNVVDADEGKTMPEVVLGSGEATAVFQNFKLPKAPLSYHLVTGNTPAETPEIAVFVGGREWQRVESLFGRDAEELVYIVREDSAGNNWVQFGDGKTGARLPNGVGNVTAIQRMGSGSFGPLKEDSKVQAAAKLKNLDKVQLPGSVTGGAPSESGDNARAAAPAMVQSLGRIVSLKDFEAEAAAIPGVARARASWQLEDNVPAVVVTVLLETGRGAEIELVTGILSEFNRQRGAARTPTTVVPGKRLYVAVSVQYALRAGWRADLVEPEIRRALGVNTGLPVWQEDQTGLFSLKRRTFGGREYASSIEGVTQNVEGVLWAKATAFAALGDGDVPADIALPGTTMLETVVVCDAQHVLSLFDAHLSLTPVQA